MTSGDCTDQSLYAALPAAAPVREEKFGVAAGAQVDTFDRSDAGTAQLSFRCGPEIEVAVDGQVGVEARRDLVADLVAARPDRGADDCRGLTSHSGDTGSHDPAAQTAPAGMNE